MARRPRGLDRLNRQLRALSPVVKSYAGRGLGLIAMDTALAIERAAPDTALKQSVGVTQGGAPGGSVLGGGPMSAGASRKAEAGLLYTIHAGSAEAFWARWTEFGTAPHSVAKGARRKSGKFQDRGPFHPGAAAHPFFYPPIRALRRSSRAKMARAGRDAAKALARLS